MSDKSQKPDARGTPSPAGQVASLVGTWKGTLTAEGLGETPAVFKVAPSGNPIYEYESKSGPREVELRLEDDRVRTHVADRITDVPERVRPDSTVRVHFADQALRVVHVRVEAPQAVRSRRVVGSRVPVGHAGLVLPAQRDRGAEEKAVRARDRPEPALDGLDPRDNCAIVTPQKQLQPHRDVAAQAFHHAHQVWRPGPLGHAIDDADHPVGRLEVGFEDQGARAVAAADGPHLAAGGQ